MEGITIRLMVAEDIPSATRIRDSIMAEETAGKRGDAPDTLFDSYIEKNPDTCLVVEEGGVVLGFILGSIREWVFGLEKAGWIEIVGVDPKFMGKGVGIALGQRLIQEFKAKGIKEVFTSVRWDSGDLISFFKSLDFDKSSFINLKLVSEKGSS